MTEEGRWVNIHEHVDISSPFENDKQFQRLEQDRRKSDQGEVKAAKSGWPGWRSLSFSSKTGASNKNLLKSDTVMGKSETSSNSITEKALPKGWSRRPASGLKGVKQTDDAGNTDKSERASPKKQNPGMFERLFSGSKNGTAASDSGEADQTAEQPQQETVTGPKASLASASSLPIPTTDAVPQQPPVQQKGHKRGKSMTAFNFLRSKAEEPNPEPEPQIRCNPGLINLGNTCYLNALLQVFFHTSKLHSILWRSYPLVEDLPGELDEEELMHVKPLCKSGERSLSSPAKSLARSLSETPTLLPEPSIERSAEETGSAQGSVQYNQSLRSSLDLEQQEVPSFMTSAVVQGDLPLSCASPAGSVKDMPPLQDLSISTQNQHENGFPSPPSPQPLGDEMGASPRGILIQNRSQDGSSGLISIPESSQISPELERTSLSSLGQTSPSRSLEHLTSRNSFKMPPPASVKHGSDSGAKDGQKDLLAQESPTQILVNGETARSSTGSHQESERPKVEASSTGARTSSESQPEAKAGPASPTKPQPAQSQKPAQKTEETISESQKRIAAMNERAKSRPTVKGRLSQALAKVLLEMETSDKAINPFPVLYYLAQQTDSLANGEQQDAHEAFMVMRQKIVDDRPETRGPSMDGLYAGKKTIKRSCNACAKAESDTKYEPLSSQEPFADISMNPADPSREPSSGTVTVATSLKAFCSPRKPSTECQGCTKRRLEAAPKRGVFGAMSNMLSGSTNKEHEDFMKESTTFDELPNCLAFHFIRTTYSATLQASKTDDAIACNLQIRMWEHLSKDRQRSEIEQGISEDNYDYRLFAVICHHGDLAERGHYTAICRTGKSDDSWRRFDDDKAPELLRPRNKNKDKDMSRQYLGLEQREEKDVCMVFYEKCNSPVTDRDSRTATLIEELRQKRCTHIESAKP